MQNPFEGGPSQVASSAGQHGHPEEPPQRMTDTWALVGELLE